MLFKNVTWGQIFLGNTVFMGKIFVLPGANVSLYMINVVSRAPAAGGSSVAIATALALNDILRISKKVALGRPAGVSSRLHL